MAEEPLADEEYASSEDSDFAPDTAQAEDGASEASDSEADDHSAPSEPIARRKRPATDADEDFENSGDEAVIQKGKKRRKNAPQKDGRLDEDDGGDGGFVKTRAMRAVQKAERKSHAVTGPVHVNVDELWAQMVAAPVVPSKAASERATGDQGDGEASSQALTTRETEASKAERATKGGPADMIKIKRTYNFAGKVHVEEKLVPRHSAEAKLHLASQGSGAEEAVNLEEALPKPKPRKAFRSTFEPITDPLPQRTDLNLGMNMRLQLREQAKGANAKKLNVVEKSRMDWAGYVDQEGIKDELELAGKSKDSFAGRQDFLARVEAKREDDARRARMAGRAT